MPDMDGPWPVFWDLVNRAPQERARALLDAMMATMWGVAQVLPSDLSNVPISELHRMLHDVRQMAFPNQRRIITNG